MILLICTGLRSTGRRNKNKGNTKIEEKKVKKVNILPLCLKNDL